MKFVLPCALRNVLALLSSIAPVLACMACGQTGGGGGARGAENADVTGTWRADVSARVEFLVPALRGAHRNQKEQVEKSLAALGPMSAAEREAAVKKIWEEIPVLDRPVVEAWMKSEKEGETAMRRVAAEQLAATLEMKRDGTFTLVAPGPIGLRETIVGAWTQKGSKYELQGKQEEGQARAGVLALSGGTLIGTMDGRPATFVR
jgi:hypothetical protein